MMSFGKWIESHAWPCKMYFALQISMVIVFLPQSNVMQWVVNHFASYINVFGVYSSMAMGSICYSLREYGEWQAKVIGRLRHWAKFPAA